MGFPFIQNAVERQQLSFEVGVSRQTRFSSDMWVDPVTMVWWVTHTERTSLRFLRQDPSEGSASQRKSGLQRHSLSLGVPRSPGYICLLIWYPYFDSK